ncbi:enamine deaminase RidA (YjgF/YER057c/UK114 family) [Pseudochelatococcus lubricantis]|uniref:Enamine deaminase RidA (YjgF/YER057c/UK114 family) n=1 Tax=Pseudochelatococcus lubricantis TaxID=1538102 RepID=A0ABX0UZG3_9HYPH|nr:RidA family protein [Pseudochelatococcus lubricantis]NIJ58346.1 enamine deaminase RidA (YjgF/YER057c/UK114 family) [Pseudochelatococcus lubricantis]
MTDIVRIDANARRSRASATDSLVFLAGQVADDRDADITAQARQAFAKVDALLAAAGTDKSRVLSVTIWLQSLDDYEAFNAVWDAWVTPGAQPCRACAVVVLADPAWRVELIVVASH